MMKKTLIATATAGLIAVGAMVGTTSTASAAGVYFGGPGWSVGIGGPGWGPQRECRPIFKTVRWWDRWGRPHFKQVVVGRDCGRNHGPHGGWGGPGPNPGWGGPGPNPGWGWHP
jgi:hypothetical protein